MQITVTPLSQSIYLGTVHIPGLVNAFFTGAAADTYTAAPPLPVESLVVPGNLLHHTERAQVSRFRTMKKQAEWVAGRITVKGLLREKLGAGTPAEELLLVTDDAGAPSLASFPDWGVSITHSHDFAMAAVYFVPGKTIGIDMEQVRPFDDLAAFVSVAFNDREVAALHHESLEDIYRAWTLKEAYLKYIRRGFHERLKDISIIGDMIHDRGGPVHGVTVQTFTPAEGYILSAVYDPDTA